MISRAWLFLRAVLFYFGYSSSLLIHSSLCIIFGWLLPIKSRYRFFVLWNRFILRWLKITCGVDYRIFGIENIPPHPFVMLSNHQSPWETIFLYGYFPPLCAILKKELLRIPFFGWALAMLNPIAIDRGKRIGARQSLLNEGRKRLADGISVLVFPEGTRVAPGEEKKYSAGGVELAVSSEALIVPITHNAGHCWPTRKFLKTPGVIDVVIGRPIPAKGRDVRELTEEVRSTIQGALPLKQAT